jgi:hypothetical protein
MWRREFDQYDPNGYLSNNRNPQHPVPFLLEWQTRVRSTRERLWSRERGEKF